MPSQSILPKASTVDESDGQRSTHFPWPYQGGGTSNLSTNSFINKRKKKKKTNAGDEDENQSEGSKLEVDDKLKWFEQEKSRSRADEVRDELSGNCRACMKLLKRNDFCHHNVKTLERSAADCKTCRLLFKYTNAQDEADRSSDDGSAPIVDVSFTRDENVFFTKLRGTFRSFELYEDTAKRAHEAGSTHRWLPLAQRWLEECVGSHRQCSGVGMTKALLPTRLARIEDGKVRVIRTDTPPSRDIPYVILSYCWGSRRTKWTMPTEMVDTIKTAGDIDISELPRTMRDAIKVTSLMGLRYLWIDALCILQDSEDWDRECLKMADYYRSALFTISALDAASAGIGFLRGRQPPASSAVLSPKDGISVRPTCVPWWRVFKDAACNQRGWTLQERLLSRRVLHFTESEIMWECLTCSKREGSATEHYGNVSANIGHSSESPDFKRSLWCLGNDPYSIENGAYSLWYRVIRFYSMRQLSVISDRLPAIAGVSLFLRELLGPVAGRYCSGLWLADPHGLLWNCARPGHSQDPRGPIARNASVPSWSWASVKDRVTYRFFEEERIASDTDAKIIRSDVIETGGTRQGGNRILGQKNDGPKTEAVTSRKDSANTSAFLGHSRGVGDQSHSCLVIDAMYRPVTCKMRYPLGKDAQRRALQIDGYRQSCFQVDVCDDEDIYCGMASLDGNADSDLFAHHVKADTFVRHDDEFYRKISFMCMALRIGERAYNKDIAVTYFLLVLRSTEHRGYWRRIGMGLMKIPADQFPILSYPTAFDNCPRREFRLI